MRSLGHLLLLLFGITFCNDFVKGELKYLSFVDSDSSSSWAAWFPPSDNASEDTSQRSCEDAYGEGYYDNTSSLVTPISDVSLTICYWIKYEMLHFTVLFQYGSISGYYYGGQIILHIHEEMITFNGEERFLTWTHYCFVIDGKTLSVILYVDGISRETKSITTDDVLLGNAFLIGDCHYGGHYYDLADPHLWMEALQVEEINKTYTCQPLTKAASVTFATSDWIFGGNATWIGTKAADTICQLIPLSNSIYVIISQPKSLSEKKQACHKFGGQLPIPKDDKENMLLAEAAKSISREHWHMYYLLGASKKKGVWMNDYTKKNLTYLKGSNDKLKPNQKDTFLSYDVYEDKWISDRVTGSTEMFGVLCHIPVTKYTIRGLCSKSLFDRYMWLYHSYEGEPIFISPNGIEIEYQEEEGKWIMKSRLPDIEAMAYMESKTFELPLGIKQWKFIDSNCGIDDYSQLSLTRCTSKEFTCGDFTCIPLKNVCNLKAECSDRSDEINCTKKASYESHVTTGPPTSDLDQKFIINFTVTVINYRNLDIKKMQAEMDLLLEMHWKDPRLVYQYLKEDGSTNVIETSGDIPIWTPDVTMKSILGAYAKTTIDKKVLVLDLDGPAMEDDPVFLKEALRYSAKHVTHHLYMRFHVKYTFDPDLHKFPFDSQKCHLVIQLDIGPEATLGWSEEVITMKSTYRKQLLEYEIMNMRMTQRNSSLSFSSTDLVLVTDFEHLYGYYILSIYMPTMLLTLISYVTFYFKPDDFTDRIMVALTSLLVLSTFLSTASASMARVSYFTFIDIWLAFCIFIVFLICIFQSVLQMLLPNDPSNNVIKVAPSDFLKFTFNQVTPAFKKPYAVRRYELVEITVKSLFPLILISFSAGYFLFALYIS